MEFDYPNIMLELYLACELIITISYLEKEDTEKDSNGPVRMTVRPALTVSGKIFKIYLLLTNV